MIDENDLKLKEDLGDLPDDGSHDLTDWEIDFIEHVTQEWIGGLTERQREAAERIIDKYKL